MIVIGLLVASGFILWRRKILTEGASAAISSLTVDICNPALIVSTMIGGEIKASHKDFLTGFGISASFYLALVLLGAVVPALLRAEKMERKYYNLMIVYTNVGFLGIPVAKAVLPADAMLYVVICNVIYNILFYTHGIATVGADKKSTRFSDFINSGTVLSVLALVIYWFNIKVPLIIASTFGYIGDATVFLSMMLLGASIARTQISPKDISAKMWIYILIRMLVIPVLFVLVLTFLRTDREMIRTFCLMSCVPAGNLPLIQAQKCGQNTDILSKGIFLTTVLSFVSITFFMTVV